jgi:hypothetical protein
MCGRNVKVVQKVGVSSRRKDLECLWICVMLVEQGADSQGRVVCVPPPYGIVRWGISAWLSDKPTGYLGAFAELRRANRLRRVWPSLRPSVYPHGATRLPMKGFSWNLIFECLSATCRENSSLIKIRRERLSFTWRSVYICDIIWLKSPENEKCFR